MSAPPTVSIIVPTYNHARFLGHALHSVIEQTCPDWEAIVVDDGSTDHPETVTQGFRENRIHFVRQENQGLAAARNTGLRHARGGAIAFLDADDVFLPAKLEQQLAALQSQPEFGVVYSDVRLCTEQGTPGESVLARLQVTEPPAGWILPALAVRNFFPVHAALIRRAAVPESGFDERLAACEDWDFWLRCAVQTRFFFLPETVGLYRHHGGMMSRDQLRIWSAALAVRRKLNASAAFAGLDRPVRRYSLFQEAKLECLVGDAAVGRRSLVHRLGDSPGRAIKSAGLIAGSVLAPGMLRRLQLARAQRHHWLPAAES